MDIFLRKAEADAIMSAMMNSVTGRFPATPSAVYATNLPASAAFTGAGDFFCLNRP
jgi:hypothetical protein